MKYATHRARSRTAYHAFVCRPGDRIDADSVNRSVRHAERPDIRACLEGSRGGSSHVFDPDSSRAPELRRQSAPHLRIAVPAIIAHTLVAPALPRFLEQHREMRVQLLIAEGRGKPDRCDAAICIRPLDLEPQWSARCLAVMPEVLCASEVFLAVHGTPHGPHELNPAHCIGVLDQDSNPSVWSFHQGSTGVMVVPTAPLMFSDAQSAVASAVRGGGFILVPELAVESQIAAGLLHPLLPDWNAPRRAVWMKHIGQLTPQLEIFADFVAGLLPREHIKGN